MVGSTQGARVEVEFDTTGADRVTSDLNRLGGQIDDTGKKSQGFWKGAIAAGTGFLGAQFFTQAIGGVKNFGMAMINGASDTAEAQSQVNQVFGDSAGVVSSWADTAAKAFGVPRAEALSTAGAMGNLFTNMGFGRDVAASMSTSMIGLSGDMASFFNISSPEAINAITSAFVGEYDSLQRLGIPINAAAVEQYALNNGIWDGVDAMTEAERATAVYGLVLENTSNVQGDYARTSDGMANRVRTLQAMFSNLTAKIGAGLLPAATALTGWAIGAIDIFGRIVASTNRYETALFELQNVLFKAFGRQTAAQIMGFVRGMISGFQDVIRIGSQLASMVGGFLADAFGVLGDNIDTVMAGAKGIAVAIGAFMAWSAITGIVAGLAAAIGLLASPLILVAGLAAVLGIAWDRNWGGIQDKTQAVVIWLTGTAWPAIQSFTQNVMDAFSADGISGAISSALEQLQAIDIRSIAVRIGGWVISTLVDLGSAVWNWITDTALPSVRNIVANIPGILVNIAGWLRGAIPDLWDTVLGWFSNGDNGMSGDGTGGARPGRPVNLGSILVNIGSWAKGVISDIWPYITQWALDAVGGLTSAAATIWGVIVNLGSWAKGIISDIWPFITMWAADAWAAAQASAYTIWGVILDIGSWAQGQVLEPLGAFINGWLMDQLVGEEFNVPGETVANKVTAAIGRAFSAGEALGGATGPGFNIGAGILSWLNTQLADFNASGIGDRVGQALGAAIARALAAGVGFESIGSAFRAGFIRSVNSEMSGSGFDAQFWSFLDNVAQVPADIIAGVAEGFVNSLITAIAPDGLVDIGPLSFKLGTLSFADGLAATFKTTFIEAVIPGSSLDIGDMAVKIGKIDFGSEIQDAFKTSFINAVIPGGSLVIDVLNLEIGGFSIGNGDGDDSTTTGDDDGGGAAGETLHRGTTKKLNLSDFSGLAGAKEQLAGVAAAFANLKAAYDANIPPITFGFQQAPTAWSAGPAAGLAGIKAAFDTTLPPIPPMTQAAFGAAQAAASSASAGMQAAVSGNANTMKANVSLAMAGTQMAVALQSAAMAAVVKVQGLVMVQSATSSANAMRAVWTAGAAGAAAGVSAGLGRIPGIVSSVGGQAVGVARGVGANIGSAFASGMESQLGRIQAAANAMVSAAATALIAKAMISSPSKLFMGYGHYVGEGFELGIRQLIPDVAAATRDLVSTPPLGMIGAGIGPGGPQTAFGGNGSSSAPTYVINTYNVRITVPPDEWIEVAQNAEAGKLAPERVAALMAKAQSVTKH